MTKGSPKPSAATLVLLASAASWSCIADGREGARAATTQLPSFALMEGLYPIEVEDHRLFDDPLGGPWGCNALKGDALLVLDGQWPGEFATATLRVRYVETGWNVNSAYFGDCTEGHETRIAWYYFEGLTGQDVSSLLGMDRGAFLESAEDEEVAGQEEGYDSTGDDFDDADPAPEDLGNDCAECDDCIDCAVCDGADCDGCRDCSACECSSPDFA